MTLLHHLLKVPGQLASSRLRLTCMRHGGASMHRLANGAWAMRALLVAPARFAIRYLRERDRETARDLWPVES